MAVEILGSVNMDIVASMPSLPLPGETVTATDVARFPGGKGANQAVAAARLGADTRLIAAIGNDEFGSELRQYLIENEVNVDAVSTIPNRPTGQAYINVADNGENAIVVVPGANHALTCGDLPAHGTNGRTISLSQFEMPLDVIEAYWASRQSENYSTLLNAAPAIPEGSALFPLADFIIVNELELARYSGEHLPAATTVECGEQARKLMTRSDQHVIVTLGAMGAIAVSATDSLNVVGQPAETVDTTGAGDCFCGALAAAFDQGQDLRSALTFANAAAAISVGRRGAGPSMPTLDELPCTRTE